MATTPTLERPPRYDVGSAAARPTTRGYWIGGVIALVGFLVAVIWGAFSVVNLYDRVDAFPRTAVTGSVDVRLDAGEDRVIFYEQPVGTQVPSLADLELSVTGPMGTWRRTATSRTCDTTCPVRTKRSVAP